MAFFFVTLMRHLSFFFSAALCYSFMFLLLHAFHLFFTSACFCDWLCCAFSFFSPADNTWSCICLAFLPPLNDRMTLFFVEYDATAHWRHERKSTWRNDGDGGMMATAEWWKNKESSWLIIKCFLLQTVDNCGWLWGCMLMAELQGPP